VKYFQKESLWFQRQTELLYRNSVWGLWQQYMLIFKILLESNFDRLVYVYIYMSLLFGSQELTTCVLGVLFSNPETSKRIVFCYLLPVTRGTSKVNSLGSFETWKQWRVQNSWYMHASCCFPLSPPHKREAHMSRKSEIENEPRSWKHVIITHAMTLRDDITKMSMPLSREPSLDMNPFNSKSSDVFKDPFGTATCCQPQI
jgi:hypothetical protein